MYNTLIIVSRLISKASTV